MLSASVANAYRQLYQQPKSAWTFELEIRPFGEEWQERIQFGRYRPLKTQHSVRTAPSWKA